jgi:hypothetical protein
MFLKTLFFVLNLSRKINTGKQTLFTLLKKIVIFNSNKAVRNELQMKFYKNIILK